MKRTTKRTAKAQPKRQQPSRKPASVSKAAGDQERQRQLAILCNAADSGYEPLEQLENRCERLMRVIAEFGEAADSILAIAMQPDLTQPERDALDAMLFTLKACLKGVAI